MHDFYISFTNGSGVRITALKYLTHDDDYIFTGDGGATIATVPRQHVLYIGESGKVK